MGPREPPRGTKKGPVVKSLTPEKAEGLPKRSHGGSNEPRRFPRDPRREANGPQGTAARHQKRFRNQKFDSGKGQGTNQEVPRGIQWPQVPYNMSGAGEMSAALTKYRKWGMVGW